MHPNDPPMKTMRGAARIFHHTDELRRLLREIPSRHNGITFCQGTITEMGVNVLEDIRYFASRDRIKLVHFRSVRGTRFLSTTRSLSTRATSICSTR